MDRLMFRCIYCANGTKLLIYLRIRSGRVVMYRYIGITAMVMILGFSFSKSYADELEKSHRIQFGVLWKANAPHLKKAYTKDELWDGVNRIGFELEYGRKLSGSIEGIITIDFIDSKDQRKEKSDFYLFEPFVWYRKTYRSKSINMGFLYVTELKKLSMAFGGTIGLSKMNYNFSRGVQSPFDILNGHDLAITCQGESTLYYQIKFLKLNYIFVGIAAKIHAIRLEGIMLDSYAHTIPWKRYNPKRGLTSGVFIKVGIGRGF